MKLISARESVEFLSQAAPRPWVQRLLRWMAFDEEIKAYSSKGSVCAHAAIIHFTGQLYPSAGEFSGPMMDEAVRREYAPEIAAKLVGKDHHAYIADDPYNWGEDEDPIVIDPGFFLFASEIDWEDGSIRVDWLEIGGGTFFEVIFPNEEMFGTDFEKPHFTALIDGISFVFSEIELLLPSVQLRQSSGLNLAARERKSSIGRPAKWDWDGAFSFIVSQAQTPDGLPTGIGAQARIEEMMAGWFEEQTGNSPAPSQVRQKASAIMKALEMPKKPKN